MSRRWLLALLLCAAFFSLSGLIYLSYTSQRDATPDFYIEWVGSRVALSGGNPYSDETTRAIQLSSKGRLVGPDEDQLAFVYPFYRVFLNAPIAFLPYPWASALWLTALLTSLLAGIILVLQALDWRPSLAELAPLLLASTFTFPAFAATMLGQMAVGVFGLLALALWAEVRGRSALAGAALALATVKPQLVALVLPLMVVWWLSQRRWRGLAGLALTLGALVVASSLVFPAWPGEFLQVLTRYPSYKDVRTAFAHLLAPWGAPGTLLAWVTWVGVALWLAQAWRGAIIHHGRGFVFAYGLTLVLTCVLLPQTSVINALICLPGVLMLLRDIPRRGGVQYLLWAGACLAVLAVPWVIYLAFYFTQYGLAMALTPLLATACLAGSQVARWRSAATACERATPQEAPR